MLESLKSTFVNSKITNAKTGRKKKKHFKKKGNKGEKIPKEELRLLADSLIFNFESPK